MRLMSLPDSQGPLFSTSGAIGRITLRRPQHQNRLHDEDVASIIEVIHGLESNPDVRVVIINAQLRADRPVFSAGYHIGQFTGANHEARFEEMVDTIESARPVTICALEGSVYGGATDIVLACDFAIAAEDVEMRMPAARLGLHYYPSGLRRYVSRLGLSGAKRAFLTARAMDARAMLAMNYVDEVVARGEFSAAVERLAGDIAALAPLALQETKKSLNEIARGDFDRQRLLERERRTMASEDFAEGRAAFAEKRAPAWRGR
jgi:enoyl-CoA hydratase/carnithine racemase